MSLKKHVKYSSLGLGLALAISATTFAPNISSAQINPESYNASSHNNFVSNKSMQRNPTIADRTGLYSYTQIGPQLFQLKYGADVFQIQNPQLAEHYRSNIERMSEIQSRANWLQIAKDATDFGFFIAQLATQHPFDPLALTQGILNYINSFPDPDTRDYLHALGELHKIYLHGKFGWPSPTIS
ncbi:hypothetical protein [Bacillus wiedmannii]|uniref:hypothetical protein n=1 Tax=Bacillus wiedmannii TaxID=1890302 RepID=UPI000BECAEDB|nr:hypothetical protein [Bacillus wiedmannii]PEF36839.1 hypothetical protein CON72_14145 [Bacillus wiedmannii]